MLWGLCHGTLRLPHGFAGRSLLGYQTLRANGTPPVTNADSLKTRFTPNAVDGDIYITSVWTSSLYRLQMRQDGTYWYEAGGDQSRQFVLGDLYAIATGLNGEGTLAINDQPPRPNTPSGTLFAGATLQYGLALNQQLQAIDPQGDAITFSVIGSLFPGGAVSSTGLTTGTPNTYGQFGFTIRLKDPYGAFSDSVEQVQVATIMPDFTRGTLLAAAQATLASFGISSSSSSVSSQLPTHTVVTQSIPPGTVINSPGTTVTFTDSNGALFTSDPNLFPTNLPGLTFDSRRSLEFNTGYQRTLPGKVSTLGRMQYPLIRWDLRYEVLQQAVALDELRQIEGLFNAKQGSASMFLYLDPAFNTVTAERFGTGDGGTKSFQLIAAYGNTGGPSIPEIIQQLQAAPAIFDNGSLVSTANYTVGSTGIVTFNTAPTTGHALTWSGSFYYLAQFDTDEFTPEEFLYRLWSLSSIRLKSIVV